MLMRTDPFREVDRLTHQLVGNNAGTWSRPTAMPMDAYRVGDEFVAAFDLPGVSPEAIELDVERERPDRQGRAPAHGGGRQRGNAGCRAPARCVLPPAVPW